MLAYARSVSLVLLSSVAVACSSPVESTGDESDLTATDPATPKASPGWVPDGPTNLPSDGADGAQAASTRTVPAVVDSGTDASAWVTDAGKIASYDSGDVDGGVLVTQVGAPGDFPFGSVVGDQYKLSFSYDCATASSDSFHMSSQPSNCGTKSCIRTSEQGQCGATLTRVSATQVQLDIDSASCAEAATMTHCRTADTLEPGAPLAVCRYTSTDCLGGAPHATPSKMRASGLAERFSALYRIAAKPTPYDPKAISETLNFPGLKSEDVYGPSTNGCRTMLDRTQYTQTTDYPTGLFMDNPGSISLHSIDKGSPPASWRAVFGYDVASNQVATCDFALKP